MKYGIPGLAFKFGLAAGQPEDLQRLDQDALYPDSMHKQHEAASKFKDQVLPQ